VLVLALIGLPACSRDESATPEAGTALAVTVQPARLEPIRDVVVSPGTIVPAASGDFTATAAEVATVVEIPVAEKGLLARNVMEASRIAAADAETALVDAQAKIDALKAQEHRTAIRARFPGVVAKVFKLKGDLLSIPGEPILRVIDPAKVQVLMHLPLAEFQRVLPGQKATVAPVGAPALPATVTMRTPPADAAAVTAEIRLELGPGAAGLTLDMPVQVEILVDERAEATTIPASATQREGLTTFVWIAGADGLAHRREVRVGIVSSGRAEITSGLAAGDRVIVTGIAELAEGLPVRVS
jgi:RND family efflux transporter MFP subunit